MAIFKTDIVDVELNGGSIHRSFLNHSIGSGDAEANRFGVRVMRNGENVDLAGVSCFGYFRNAEGTNIALTSEGTVSGNVAYVTLPQACYNVEGNFTLAIKLIGGGVTGTMRIVDGMVDNTNTGGAVAPTEDVPTYTEILAVYAQMQETLEDYDETVAGQDAKIEKLQSETGLFEELTTEKTLNFWEEGDISVPANPGYINLLLRKPIPAGTYLLTGFVTSDAQNNSAIGFSASETQTSLIYASMAHAGGWGKASALVTFTEPMKSIRVLSANNISNSFGHASTWKNLQLEATESYTEYNGYIAPYSSIDIAARDGIDELTNKQIPVSAINHADGWDEYTFDSGLPNGKYTLLLNVSSSETNTENLSRIRLGLAAYGDGIEYDGFITRDTDHHIFFDVTDHRPMVFRIFASNTVDSSSGKTLTINKFALYHGEIISKDENFDCSEGINHFLNTYGTCELDAGEYVAKKTIEMPLNSSISGRDGKTKLVLSQTADDSFSVSNETGTSFIGFNSSWGTEWNQLPAGLYRYTANISTNSEAGPRLRPCKTTNYGSANVIADIAVRPDADASGYFYAPVPINSVFVFGGDSTSYTGGLTVNSLTVELVSCIIYAGDYSVVRDLEMVGASSDITPTSAIGKKNGLLWYGNNIRHNGIVENCKIHGFNGAGILGAETGLDTNSGMMISNCSIYNNTVGIYFALNCEFNKISNCAITYNYYGYYNRGGNNVMSNCGIDSNVVGIQIDADQGSNNGHGNITGCTINHSNNNNGYGIVIKDTGRMLVSNCNLYYSDILLQNTNGNIIANCGFGTNAEIEVVGGGCSIIEGCMMRNQANTITVTNNNAVKVINCFDRSGNAITPTEAA